MKAISLIPGTTRVSLADIAEPMIRAGDEVKIKMIDVGICGTDREQVSGGRADAPDGETHLIIGHEMFGQVVEIGENVTTVQVGDYGVFTVRRGCGECLACANNRSDLCYSGRYIERGIKEADGFQAEYVVDKEQYLVKIPEKLKSIGVLTEPMSIAAKAIDEAMIIQGARLKSIVPSERWLDGKKALVAGIGAIGLMAAFALSLRGAKVIGVDIVDEHTLRPRLLKEIGGTYVDGREVRTTDLDEVVGESDFVFEATGIARLQIDLIDALAVNGIYVATGIPEGKRPTNVIAGDVMKQLVLKNQILLGSVNASYEHYIMAVKDLEASMERWPGVIEQVITNRVSYQNFLHAFHEDSGDDIKEVIGWSEP